MNVTITGRHMDMTNAIRDYVEGGLDKVCNHFDKVIDVDVVLSVEKRRHIAEINLHANGLRINAKESSEDMYASVDAALNKVDKQVLKHKARILRHQPRTAREARSYDHRVVELSLSDDTGGAEETVGEKHQVVLREKRALPTMTVDEAALQLDLIDEPFFVFMTADTHRLNVLYAREDGVYGIIEPEL